jgi:hypothetical protein
MNVEEKYVVKINEELTNIFQFLVMPPWYESVGGGLVVISQSGTVTSVTNQVSMGSLNAEILVNDAQSLAWGMGVGGRWTI